MNKLSTLIVLTLSLLVSCKKDTLPKVETLAATVIDATHITLNGNVVDEGSTAVTNRGFFWAFTPNPASNDHVSQNGSGSGEFTEDLQVVPDTLYYIKAYATNDKGTAYGNEIYFNTSTMRPKIETLAISGITNNSAQGGGNIISDGGLSIISRGICWATSNNVSIADDYTKDGAGIGSFTSILTGLTSNTKYYVRAYATNISGTFYGNMISFPTLGEPFGSFTDERDNKTYQWVRIGTQTWMAENLAYLPSVGPSNTGSSTTPHYYVNEYEGTNVSEAKATANYQTYGVLYNWPAAVFNCPTGWHLPSIEEWGMLIEYLGGGQAALLKLKSRNGWPTDEQSTCNGNNNTGFNAYPGGYWYQNYFNGNNLGIWSSTTRNNNENSIQSFVLWCDLTDLGHGAYLQTAISVRCLKGEGEDVFYVITHDAYNITPTSAKIDCEILTQKALIFTQKGVCWKMVELPTIFDSKTNDGSGLEPFTSNLIGLEANATYYARAYCVSNGKVWYGNFVIFQTGSSPK